MNALQRFVDIFNGRTHRPDPAAPPTTPSAAPEWQPITFRPRSATVPVDLPVQGRTYHAADDAEEGDGAGAKRFAHGRIIVEGTLYLVRFDRQTCDLNIRKAFARSGCTFYGPELVKHAQRMKRGSLGL